MNVNGLSASRKRRAFFLQLLQGNWDVIALMETHCPINSDIAEQWLREGAGPGRPWLGTAHWNHGTSRSRGVAVLNTCAVGMHVQRSVWIMHMKADVC